MSSGKSILRAAAPVTLLLVLAAGARFLPSVLGKNAAEDSEAPAILSPKPPTPNGHMSPPPPKPVPEKLADAKTQAALQKVVSGQLEALAKEDFAAALRYGGAEFRQTTSPEDFHRIIETGFNPMLHFKTVRFAPARCSADTAMMAVSLVGRNGGEVSYLYNLHRDKTPVKGGHRTGNWWIAGVMPAVPSGFSGAMEPDSPHVTNVQEI